MWTPYIIKVIVGVITGIPTPAIWDQISDTATVIYSSLSVWLLYCFDIVVESDVNRLLKIKGWRKSSEVSKGETFSGNGKEISEFN